MANIRPAPRSASTQPASQPQPPAAEDKPTGHVMAAEEIIGVTEINYTLLITSQPAPGTSTDAPPQAAIQSAAAEPGSRISRIPRQPGYHGSADTYAARSR